ncbi:hypothetical protein D521_0618 [beta proteobacterium CB]|jgi:hypothetical protein|nr:hypothetical protein D521_0618 [beta proteobacterium CB]
MDILAFLIAGLFVVFIFRVTIGSLGLPLGLAIGFAILAVIFGAYFLFFASVFSLAEMFGAK